eukprot:gene38631-18813_t
MPPIQRQKLHAVAAELQAGAPPPSGAKSRRDDTEAGKAGAQRAEGAPAGPAGAVSVTVTRGAHEEWLPFGIGVDEDTMALRQCTVGSPAARSEVLRGCVG